MAMDKVRKEKLAKICANINKRWKSTDGSPSVNYIGNQEIEMLERFSSGSTDLDAILGGGWPIGRICEIYGGESVGKSTLMLHAIAEFQQKYPEKDVAFVDSEFCLAKGSLVYDADNMSYTPVEDMLNKEISVISLDKTNKIIKQRAIIKSTGRKKYYKIKCQHGFELNLTGNHKVLTGRGYVEVDKLSTTDIVYSPSILPSIKNNEQNNDLYRILGYHIGDGTRGRTEIATIDEKIVCEIKNIIGKYDCVSKFNGKVINIKKKDTKFYKITKEFVKQKIEKECLTLQEIANEIGCTSGTLRERIDELGLSYNYKKLAALQRVKRPIAPRSLTNNYTGGGGLKNNIFNFLSKFDSFNLNSQNRRLPKCLTEKQLQEVLAGMFMSDGTVIDSDKKKRCKVSYSTTSKILALDLQAALLRFGVFSWISKGKKKRKDSEEFYRTGYTVNITSHKDVDAFNENVKLISYKKDRIEKALKSVKKIQDRKNYQDGLIVHKIDEIIECEQEDTYDVSVNNMNFYEQNFLCDGIFIHNCMEPHYAKKLGVDVDNLIICQPESGELAFDVIDSLIEEGIKLIIVDSVAALTPKAELEKDAGEVTVGSQARLMSVQLRKIISKAKLNNVCVLFTNQIRDKIGVMGWGEKTTTPGGQALKFYASIRVALARLGSEKDGDESVGNRVKATTKKNKTCAPFKSSEFLIMFGEGIDNDAGIFEKAVELKVIAKAGAWFNYGETRIGQGKKASLEFVKNSPDMLKEIAEKVLAKIEEQANKKEAKKAAALDKALAGEISSKVVADDEATEEEKQEAKATDDIEVDDV